MTQELPELTLVSGRKIFADEAHIGKTYAGLLEGIPNDDLNARLLQRIPSSMRRIFGDAPIFISPPEIERRTEPHPMGGARQPAIMPPFQLAMRFISYSGVSSDDDFSQLIIVWHQHDLTWDANARDFND